MIIDKKLFDECLCPCEGIGRICLNGSKGIPKELEDMARRVDGDNYLASCFSIEIFENGALIYYMAEDDFKELLVCDNYKEALEYYEKNASKDDLEETFSTWENSIIQS